MKPGIIPKRKEYRASKKVCIDCPMRGQCLGKTAQEKKFTITFYREEYERNNTRLNSKKGRYLKTKRQSTVEPVLGTLKEFMGLRKVNTIGIKQANKGMHLAATAYNLKKYLNFINKSPISMAGIVEQAKKGLTSVFLAVKWPLWSKTGCFQAQYELVMLKIRYSYYRGCWVD